MNIPTYNNMLDFVDGFFDRFKKDDGKPRAGSIKDELLKEAEKRYDNIVGRFDSLKKILKNPKSSDFIRFWII